MPGKLFNTQTTFSKNSSVSGNSGFNITEASPKATLPTVYSRLQDGQSRIFSIAATFHAASMHHVTIAGQLMKRYPPVRAFAYTLGALSAVPVVIFTGVTMVTCGTVAVVAGAYLAASACVLTWALLLAMVMSAMMTAAFSAAYFCKAVALEVQAQLD